jgi:hypothetical protein
VAILLLYALLFFLWIYGLTREIRRGPEPAVEAGPAGPISAAVPSPIAAAAPSKGGL